MHDCFLSIGSNMGNKFKNIHSAIEYIESSPENSYLSKSKIYESKAMYNSSLDNFYNAVIRLETAFSPLELLAFIKKIEKEMGRVRSSERYSARPIDIDILSYGKKILNSRELTIPHPHIEERKFVLKPWSDIDSTYVLARTNKKISELLNETSDHSELLTVKK